MIRQMGIIDHYTAVCQMYSAVAFFTEKYLMLYNHEIWHMLCGAACISIYVTLNCAQCAVRT